MKKSVKHLSDTKVAITVNLTTQELDDAKSVALGKLAHDIKVPGFRQGRVPASVAAKHVSAETLAEATLESALNKAVADAFMSENLQALDRPEVEVKKYVPGSELEFVASCEILPTIKLGDYKKLSAKPEKVTVSKQDVDEIIERIQKGFAEKATVKRAAKDGDEVNIDFVGKKDDVAFEGGSAEGHDIVIGSASFIPGFEDGLIGHKAGETFDIPLSFPKTYHVADLKGAKVVFTVTINEVKAITLPELTDELAAKAGPFKTAQELRDDIKREITAQKEREAGEKHKDALVSELVDKSTVPVPEILVSDQLRSIEQDMVQNLAYQGLNLDNYLVEKNFKDKQAWLDSEAREAAEKRVKSGLVLAELSKLEKIEASKEELLEQMNLLGQQYNDEKMLEQLKSPEAQRDMANRILTNKTVDRLVELNTTSKK